jgi:hypothetical protein
MLEEIVEASAVEEEEVSPAKYLSSTSRILDIVEA